MQFSKQLSWNCFKHNSLPSFHNNLLKWNHFNVTQNYIKIFLSPSLEKTQFKISCMSMTSISTTVQGRNAITCTYSGSRMHCLPKNGFNLHTHTMLMWRHRCPQPQLCRRDALIGLVFLHPTFAITCNCSVSRMHCSQKNGHNARVNKVWDWDLT